MPSPQRKRGRTAGPMTPLAPSRARFWALSATHVMNDFQSGAAAALLPYFVSEQNYTYTAVAGLALAATSLSSVAQPLFGYLTDKLPLRPLTIIGMSVAALGIAVAGLTSANYWLTWIVVAISGIGVAAYHPPATVDAKMTGGGSDKAMSLFSVAGNLGAAIAPICVGLTVGLFGLVATPLLLIPTAVVAVIYVAAMRATRNGAAPTSRRRSASATAAVPADQWGRFVWLLAIICLWSITALGIRSFIALDVTQAFHGSDALGTSAFTIYSLAAALGTLMGGFIADRFGRRAVMISGYALSGLATLAIGFAPNTTELLIAAGVAGWALSLPFAVHVTLSHSFLPRHLGTASGVTLGLSMTLGGFVTPLLGILADRDGIAAIFIPLASVVSVGAVMSVFIKEGRNHLNVQDAPVPDELKTWEANA
ncbi:membrane efflux protein (fosmidomycin resistance) [Leifsonia xyli subsp. xyli str. CTCB07]|uniref:Membrane efflux protein (Fosmidomycin resistance) n=1 Tax=Leifsonia xyli subsp. xyli (strain CTCB07) TaxID=281090 RepID=Q6AE08_LEIXX|nr:membrane efflux protein (fosmidomycin resistance) [Leifsonia xyli subsp. xyli str. CTCB07]